MIINSTTQETTTALYKGAFQKATLKGETKEVHEPLITHFTVGIARARAEFLEYGHDKQEVEFTTYFSPIKINSIIKVYAPKYRIPKNLEKDRFIVKKIAHIFKDGVVKTKIKAVRYDF